MADDGADPKRHVPSPATADRWACHSVHTIEQIWPVVDEIGTALEKAGFTTKQVFAARLSLEEAISNGVKHGNRHDPRKTVKIRFQVDETSLRAEIEDEGPGFNPDDIPNPLAPENLEREGGRGILLIRRYMTHADHNELGNCLRILLTRKER